MHVCSLCVDLVLQHQLYNYVNNVLSVFSLALLCVG